MALRQSMHSIPGALHHSVDYLLPVVVQLGSFGFSLGAEPCGCILRAACTDPEEPSAKSYLMPERLSSMAPTTKFSALDCTSWHLRILKQPHEHHENSIQSSPDCDNRLSGAPKVHARFDVGPSLFPSERLS